MYCSFLDPFSHSFFFGRILLVILLWGVCVSLEIVHAFAFVGGKNQLLNKKL